MLRNLTAQGEFKMKDIFKAVETHQVIHDGKSELQRIEEAQAEMMNNLNNQQFNKDDEIKKAKEKEALDMIRRSPSKKDSPLKRHKAKTSMSLNWISSIQKISTSIASSRIFHKNPGEILFCCSVDGSQHSDYAFECVTENFLKKFSKILCCHVFNSRIDHILNYNNRKSTVLEKYATNIERYKGQGHFVTEDKVSERHALEQVCRHSESYQANYFVCGYSGIKGPRGDNNELSAGVHYLLSMCRTPCMIIKERSNRMDNGGFKWLVVLDRQWSNCFRAFNAFAPLMNPSLDTVHCLAYYPHVIPQEEDLKKQFYAGCERYSLLNTEYEANVYSKRPVSVLASERVNFGEEHYDFVIFYNNSGKHRENPENSDGTYFITRAKSNICFFNN